MPRDHYVAQTYLRHFADPDGMLHVYRKAEGKYWRCSPKDVCHEWDGDIIRDIVKNEKMLGAYRAIFEPRWNDAITDLKKSICGAAVKMAIAGYRANLLVSTPAWTRRGIKMLIRDLDTSISEIQVDEEGQFGSPCARFGFCRQIGFWREVSVDEPAPSVLWLLPILAGTLVVRRCRGRSFAFFTSAS